MNTLIVDDTKKESKWCGILAIFIYLLSLLSPLLYLTNQENYEIKDVIILSIVYFALATFVLYCWLEARRYRIEITESRIKIRTLFKKKEILFSSFIKYTYKQVRIFGFYQFILYMQDKKALFINTHYKEEFETILNQNNINLKD